MELVENAYPEAAFKVELARDQFVQGVAISNKLREKVFVSQRESLVKAVRVVRRLESARKACQAAPAVEKKKSVNVVSASAESEKISTEIRELKELVLGMNDTIRDLERTAKRLRPRGTVMSWYVLLAAHLAILLEIVHADKGETELGACRGPGSPRET